jgi:hypothetical protein
VAERELMEKAARAAGIELLCWDNERQAFKLLPRAGRASRWNPWTDDGDAFRLQCRLSMTVAIDAEDKTATAVFYGGKLATEPCRDHREAPAATRRAIVRCAALALELLTPLGVDASAGAQPKTVPIEEYRRVVARCIELGEKIAAGTSASDSALVLDLEHRAKWWRQARVERVTVDNVTAEDFARELDRAVAALRASGVALPFNPDQPGEKR